VVISASHNPPEFNGIKLFDRSGMKLPDAVEDAIEAYVLDGVPAPELRVTGPAVGYRERIDNARELYISHALSTVNCRLDGLVIAVDCAHGAACKTTPEALMRLGATVVAINTDHDGLDINVACGSTHLEPLRELVARTHADVGLAHDGDADRVLFIDEKGQEVDGDFVLAICARALDDKGELPGHEVVSTVMANLGFMRACEALGLNVPTTAVGDRYVLERMIEDGATLGGEQSGHIIFLDYNSTGDGLVTALQLLQVLHESGGTLSELKQVMRRYPQELINIKVASKAGWEENAAIAAAIEAAEKSLGDDGRLLVRASGTEPLIRVMVEAQEDAMAHEVAAAVAAVVEAELA
jgi:phosphoglucosamine mutase